MEIIWSPKAKDNLLETLEYWEVHNGSPLYSDKIIEEIKSLLQELSNNPYFMGRYIEKLNLYVRPILKGRFLIYFQLKEDNSIEIQHFRSSKQRISGITQNSKTQNSKLKTYYDPIRS